MKDLCAPLNRFADEYYAKTGLSGLLRITSKDTVVYEKSIGFANREKEIPFDCNSVFTLYSMTKPFTAMGLLKLRDRGLVDIDSHPGKYVPEAEGFSKDVTIRQMLHHISGLPDFVRTAHFPEKYAAGQAHELHEQVRELTAYPMLFTPGTQGFYANINFILAAFVIENVSDMTYPDYMKTEVFAPLGMQTAQVDSPGLAVPNRVQGYTLHEGTVERTDRTVDWIYGAGDILGTVEDVYCLNKAIKHRLLLKPETWDEVLTPSPHNSMGMGCTVTNWHGKYRITHNGGHPGFRTLHIQLPEDDFDIILLSNCSWGDMRNEVSEEVYKICYGSQELTQSDTVKMDSGYI